MNRIFTALFLVALSLPSFAQSIKDISIDGTEIDEQASLLSDGYMVVDNSTLSYLKFDFSGNLEWAKRFDASQLNYINSVEQSVNGNLFFLGETMTYELILIKTDNSGVVQWSKIIDRQESSYTMSKITIDEFENVYVMPSQSSAISYLKFDSIGNELWSTSFTVDPTKNPAFHFTVLPDGSIIGTAKADSDIQIYRMDKFGNIVMNIRYGGNFSYEYYCHATIMEELSENLFLTGGYFENPNGESQLLLMKTDSLANIIDSKTFSHPIGQSGYYFYPFASNILSDGTIAIAYDSGYGVAIAYFNQNLNFIRNIYLPDTYYYMFVFTGVSIKNDQLIAPYYDLNGIGHLMRFDLLSTDFNCGLTQSSNLVAGNYAFNSNNFSSNYTSLPALNSSNVTINSSTISGITYSTICGAAESELGIIADENAGEFVIYPNPATQFITIETEMNEGTVSIYDMQGKLVFENGNTNCNIDVSGWEKGIYLVSLMNSEEIQNQKFIKE